MFFGTLVEWILSDIIKAKKWKSSVSTYPDLMVTQAASMDDLLLWDGSNKEVQDRFNDFREGFAQWGLLVNVDKCSLYVSPKHKGPNQIVVEGSVLQAKDTVQVMGVEFRVGANVQELLQPTLQRAKAKFWSISHLLKSHTPLAHRMHILRCGQLRRLCPKEVLSKLQMSYCFSALSGCWDFARVTMRPDWCFDSGVTGKQDRLWLTPSKSVGVQFGWRGFGATWGMWPGVCAYRTHRAHACSMPVATMNGG